MGLAGVALQVMAAIEGPELPGDGCDTSAPDIQWKQYSIFREMSHKLWMVVPMMVAGFAASQVFETD